MKEEELLTAYDNCYNAILQSSLSSESKIELFINLRHFLNPELYELNKMQLQNVKDGKELGIINVKKKIIKAGTTVELKDFYK